MKLTMENLWNGISLASIVSTTIVLLTGCLGSLRSTVTSNFLETGIEYDAEGNITAETETSWTQNVKAAPFGKIDEAALKTSYEFIDTEGVTVKILQGQDVKGMDNSGQIEAFNTGVNAGVELLKSVVPLLAPKPPSAPSPPKPTLPKIIEELLPNAPTP